jgi:hypothetical protein
MRPRDDPWRGIERPGAGDVSALRVDPSARHAFFWARKADGRIALLLNLASDPGMAEALPQLRGVEVLWMPEHRQLQLVLSSPADADMFHVLCLDLMGAASAAHGDVECLRLLVARLVRWQRLMSRGGPRLLSDQEIRGLHAELLLLRDHLLPRYGPAAVACWLGPDGHPQDFALDSIIIEVKAHLVGSLPEARISSLEQLWPPDGRLFLWVQHLSSAPGAGESLPGLIADVAHLLETDASHLELFERKLEDIRYVDLPQYGEIRHLAGAVETFEVTSGFPRIDPATVPRGVTGVTYSVQLADCARFAAGVQWPTRGESA